MNRYIVFLKQVPQSNKIKINPKNKTLMRQSAAGRTNPDDLYALEAALWAKSVNGGEVVAVTMGPESATATLREAIQRGADRAVLLSDKAFAGSDTLCTSLVLARAAQKVGDFTALFFGKMAIDGDTAQVGPEVAAHLDIPQITSLSSLDSMDSEFIEVTKRVDNCTQKLRIKLPCAIMVSKNIGSLPSPTLDGWRRAQKADITREDITTLNIDPSEVGLEASPTKVVDTYIPTQNKKMELINSVDKLLITINSSISTTKSNR
ncbi:MAG: electron transfer flavoprotein subunit beta/FixA family protein [Rikenellaceae bacterium]